MTRVSVVIPCFNAERWLSEVLDSCLSQGPLLGEIIVVDDGSSDRSREIAQDYAARHPGLVRTLRNTGNGGNAARTFGFEHAQFDLIQWLDADDYLLPGKFEAQVPFLNGVVEIVYSDWADHHHDAGYAVRGQTLHIMNSDEPLLLQLAADQWSVPANYLMTRALARRVVDLDGWNVNRKVAQDREFFTIAALLSPTAQYVPGVFSTYNRQTSGTVSGMSFKRRLELQMSLEGRLHDLAARTINTTAERAIVLRRFHTHCINAFFYNRSIQPRFFFWPWQVESGLIHWKKRLVYPALYLGAMLNYLRWRMSGKPET